MFVGRSWRLVKPGAWSWPLPTGLSGWMMGWLVLAESCFRRLAWLSWSWSWSWSAWWSAWWWTWARTKADHLQRSPAACCKIRQVDACVCVCTCVSALLVFVWDQVLLEKRVDGRGGLENEDMVAVLSEKKDSVGLSPLCYRCASAAEPSHKKKWGVGTQDVLGMTQEQRK